MQTISLKKITLLGFSGPITIMLGAFISVALGRGQAIMLPNTVAALTFYGVMIAVAAAWRDGAPGLFRWTNRTPSLLIGLVAIALALSAIGWLAAAQGMPGFLWRPLLATSVCVWLGIGLSSAVRVVK